MPKKVDRWECSLCRRDYETEEDALLCEKNHNTRDSFKIVGIDYFGKRQTIYPASVSIINKVRAKQGVDECAFYVYNTTLVGES